jgi:hypothetical protein
MSITGSMVAASLWPVGIMMGWDRWSDPGLLSWAAVILVALAVAAVGCLTMRFELTGTANHEGCIAEERDG